MYVVTDRVLAYTARSPKAQDPQTQRVCSEIQCFKIVLSSEISTHLSNLVILIQMQPLHKHMARRRPSFVI